MATSRRQHVYYTPTARPDGWKSSVRKPSGFDRFWDDTLAATENVSLNPRLTPVSERSTPEVEVFEAKYDSYGGVEIAGWYARPRAAIGKLPAVLFVPGYVSEPKLPTDLAQMGFAAFSAAPRGKLRSNSAFNPGYPGLLTHNITDRDSYGYRGFYMDAVRAFDFLAGLPEVDASRVGVQGSSQGGALTLLVAALRAGRVACASAGAPYLCSMMDAASLTRSYPYEEINDHLRIRPADRTAVRATLDWYDIHNFVDRITCPIIVNIGLRDDVVPPETGYAVFEAIRSGDKKLYAYEDCGHDAGTGIGHAAVVNRFLTERLNAEPVKRTLPAVKPAGTGDRTAARKFWADVAGQVARLVGSPTRTEELSIRSNESSTVYGARFEGTGGYPLFAYLSVPKGEGKFPALLEVPGYGSVRPVPSVERRARYLVMGVCHRGQRLSDAGYRAAYPGLLTDGLPAAGSYRMKDVVADSLRAFDILASLPETDSKRVGIAGNDLALIVAALRPAAKAVLMNGPVLFCGTLERLGGTDAYPIQEFNDFRSTNAGMWAEAAKTLALFDPVHLAGEVRARTFVAGVKNDTNAAGPFLREVGALADVYVNTGKGHIDHEAQEEWLSGLLDA